MNELSPVAQFSLEQDDNGIAFLTFNKSNSSVNTLNTAALAELEQHLQALRKGKLPKGLVIQSSKQSGFCAGADIHEIKNIESEEAAFNLLRSGQLVFNLLADCPFPTLALLQGVCFGGGLELALACRYRIAIQDKKTKLGLPEVHLGIHPGWGGSVRLPRLIGATKALELILSGKSISAKEALKMGVVDACVPIRYAKKAVLHFILTEPPAHRPNFFETLSNANGVRPLLGKIVQKRLSHKVSQQHYPAPFAAIDNWVKQGVIEAAFIAEAKSVSELALTDTARNLFRVFELQEKLKSLARPSVETVRVHVIGAGVMGGDIAGFCALKGMQVTLQDQNKQAIAVAQARNLALFKRQLKEPHLICDAMDRLLPDSEGFGIPRADFIIEAIIENTEAKQALFTLLEQKANPAAILATNTSTIPLTDIAKGLQNPGRLLGLHFFNPVPKMPLVEVVHSEITHSESVNRALAFVRALDKLPLPVKSAPGFLVNRILMPYLLESMLFLTEGVPPPVIDKVAVEFGMPMGPIELADTVGLDVCLYAAESLNHYLGGEKVPEIVREMVTARRLGKKTNQGFYRYKNGKAIKEKVDPHYRLPVDISDRLILRMCNEAVACLRENIVQDAEYIDAGMIFGAGFPPFRGGPLHYVFEQGESLVLQRLTLLSQRYGKRFLPDVGWRSLESK